MKINTLKSSDTLYGQQPTQSSSSFINQEKHDPIMAILNPSFYQQLQTRSLNSSKDVLLFLKDFDVKNERNQTLKEKRQLDLLMYAHQQSELEDTENKAIINQALIAYLSFQGVYHQFALEITGMIDTQEEYSAFFKPDSASFTF